MKNKQLIIGLLGESKSGKDWISKEVIEHFNINRLDILHIKCADILKIEANKRFPNSFDIQTWETSGDEYREVYVEELKGTRRKLLQDLGNELSSKNPRYVYDYVYSKITNSDSKAILISDVRNSLESTSILDSGGIIIKVHRALKSRYPKHYGEYKESLDNPPLATLTGFKEFIKFNYPDLHRKLNHSTETSINKVSEDLININFYNSQKSGHERRMEDLMEDIKKATGM